MDIELLQLVQDWLKKKRFPSEATLHNGQMQKEVLIFLPKSVIAKVKSHTKTSIRHMSHIKRMAQNELGVKVDFRIMVDENDSNIESGLCAIVRSFFQNLSVNAFLISSPQGKTDVWIEGITPINVDTKNMLSRLHDVIGDYFEKVGLSLHQIYWEGPHVPSFAGLLRAVKVTAPATPDEISKHLAAKGYSSIPSRWLSSRLDGLRRDGLIIWYDGKYVVTTSGLSLLPKSRGRLGSDVERSLALARRQWQNDI